MRAYDKIIELGYEGIIVRHNLAPYERKRSTLVMKFKPKKEDIYEILDFREEISIDGIPKGTLGALVCKGGEGDIFSVGTGFNSAMREMLWNTKDSLCGKSVRISYQHLTSGRRVPRFPVFVSIEDQ
jgi:DNA ligase-1